MDKQKIALRNHKNIPVAVPKDPVLFCHKIQTIYKIIPDNMA